MGAVSLRGLRKRFGDVEVLHGIDLDVHEGEFMVFVGPSGCGKTTTLRMIAGLESISDGTVHIDGQRANDLRPADRGCAMVFQSYALYPHMTVAENMGFALKMAGVGRRERDAQVARAAEILCITDYLARYPKQLSGGQRQRVAIGRAIVRKPKVFLFDEPLSNLDAALRVNMRIELARLHKELGRTMIYVTHDQVEAMTLGDRIAVFHAGRVEQIGAPMDLYQEPANAFVASFLGAPRINFVERPGAGAPAPHRAYWDALWGSQGSAPAGAVRAGLRPERLQLAPDGQGVPAELVLAEHLGDSSILHLRVDGLAELQTAKIAAGATQVAAGPGAAGQAVGLRVDARALAFDHEGRRVA